MLYRVESEIFFDGKTPSYTVRIDGHTDINDAEFSEISHTVKNLMEKMKESHERATSGIEATE